MSVEESVVLDTSPSRPSDEKRRRARPTIGYLAVLLSVGLLCPSTACSLKNFDYLKEGSSAAGDSSVGGQDSGGGGNANIAGESSGGDSGGKSSAGGTTATRGGSTGSSVGGTSAATTTAPSGKLINPGFENGSTGWTADPASELGWPNNPSYAAFVQAAVGTATVHEGASQLSFYRQSGGYTVKISQKIAGITDGKYTFSGWFTRGSLVSAYMYATGCGGTDPAHVDIPLGDIWTQVKVEGIDVVGGTCEVGFYVEGGSTNWLNADDFAFEPVAAATTTGG